MAGCRNADILARSDIEISESRAGLVGSKLRPQWRTRFRDRDAGGHHGSGDNSILAAAAGLQKHLNSVSATPPGIRLAGGSLRISRYKDFRGVLANYRIGDVVIRNRGQVLVESDCGASVRTGGDLARLPKCPS